VRETLSTANAHGRIDAATLNWVESTLQLDRSTAFPQTPGPSHFPSLNRLSSRSSADMASVFADDVVQQQLSQVLSWRFDMFKFVNRCPKHYLSTISVEIFQQLRLYAEFDVNTEVMVALMDKLEATYCYSPSNRNDYHNAMHAADVMQGVAVFCQVRPVCCVFVIVRYYCCCCCCCCCCCSICCCMLCLFWMLLCVCLLVLPSLVGSFV